MAFDDPTRSRLARFVGKCRDLLSEEFTRQLQSIYGIDPESGDVAEIESLSLTNAERETARLLRDTMEHYLASADTSTAAKAKNARVDVLSRIVREQAFTVLNRLCALRMSEGRELLIESIGKGYQSKGFQLYKQLASTALGETGDAYRCFLFSLFDEFALDLPVLFDRFSPEGRLFPREAALIEVLDQVNHAEIDPLWAEDETIGWIYQYFNTIEERAAMRKARSPRNSRELAVRNQFFTPRYVVEFLTDNTLGRIWYEMTQGQTGLQDSCRYMVRRPNEIFLAEGDETPEQEKATEDLSQEELLNQLVYIPHRPLKDPRDIKMLDPACGSMHFGLYTFDLFERIYDEAWDLEDKRGADAFVRPEGLKPLHETYATRGEFLLDVPRLIIERNIHGIDIDPRAVQIAGLSLWLRAQKSWRDQGLQPQDRPQIQRSNIVCAEPMPGEADMLEQFLRGLRDDRLESLIRRVLDVPENQQVRATARMAEALCDLVRTVWKEMELAGEAGSLLKIEESLAYAIAKGKEEWEEKLPLFRVQEFSLGDAKPKTNYVKVLPGGEEDFWNRAEAIALSALEEYAEHASGVGASRKRMFARDAMGGFALIDICRKRYDVSLMNPPFGKSCTRAEQLLSPIACGNVYAAFVTEALRRSTPRGMVGAITDRTFLLLPTYAPFRAALLKEGLCGLLDLDWGVLDGAQVATCAYIVSHSELLAQNASWFIDARTTKDKQAELSSAISDRRVEVVDSDDFKSIPTEPIAHWAPPRLRKAYRLHSLLEPGFAIVRKGLSPGDSDRFVKLWWEVPNHERGLGHSWAPYANGGSFSPFARDPHEVVLWRQNGREIRSYTFPDGRPRYVVRSADLYGKPGLTFGKRGELLNVQILPSGCVFSNEGYLILPGKDVPIWALLAYLNSDVARYLVNMVCGLHKEVGAIKVLPIPEPVFEELEARLREDAKIAYDAAQLMRAGEIEPKVGFPFSLGCLAKLTTLSDAMNDLPNNPEHANNAIVSINWSVDKKAFAHDGLDIRSPRFEVPTFDFAAQVLSLVIGIIFGRWDIRFVMANGRIAKAPSPFDALPRCVPGLLCNDDGTPIDLNELTDRYPVPVAKSGIVSHQVGRDDEMVRFVQQVLDAIWAERSSEIEHELAEALGAESLSDYLRDFAAFFDSHLQRYTRGRRQAPIYWPLATLSGSYTIWLYYHRLTDQTLYTCVNDFIEPKLKQVAEESARLRGMANRSSAEEKELERSSDLELELKDFRDDLLRIAKFWKPNLNDGVQITAAPLWKLFQHRQWQKRLKETWEKLEAGEYDWAHLALSIWPERVVKASHKDRSYAIAHDLEDQLWEEVEVEKRTRGGRVKKVMEWRQRDLTEHQLIEITAEVKAR